MMTFYIVTPSFNQLEHLRRCVLSIRDQVEVDSVTQIAVHHHVQDGASTDGSAEWIKRYAEELPSNISNYTFTYESISDNGMYDAINRGWNVAPDDVDLIAWLNCDEQYLEGTLAYVSRMMQQCPEAEILFGDLLMVDSAGELLAFRKGYQPRWQYIITDYLYTFTCTMFLRKEVFDAGHRLSDEYKIVADEEFVVRLLRAGVKAKHFSRYFATFVWDGNNLSCNPRQKTELARHWLSAPAYIKRLKKMITVLRLIEKLLSGAYWQKFPLKYSIYTSDSSTQRHHFLSSRVSQKWPSPPE